MGEFCFLFLTGLIPQPLDLEVLSPMSFSHESTEPGKRSEGTIHRAPESDSNHMRSLTRDSHVGQERLIIFSTIYGKCTEMVLQAFFSRVIPSVLQQGQKRQIEDKSSAAFEH